MRNMLKIDLCFACHFYYLRRCHDPHYHEIIGNTMWLQASNCAIYSVSVAVMFVSEYVKEKWHIRKEWVTERINLQAFFTDMIFF